MVSSENIRKEMTEIGNLVQFQKENYIVTKNNKPSFGIVPLEALQLLIDIFLAAPKNKAIYDITKNHMINITPEDRELLMDLLSPSTTMNKNLKKAAKSAKSKINNI